nr:MAG TPA: hypothetical protein [Caudoviricetes sp.]
MSYSWILLHQAPNTKPKLNMILTIMYFANMMPPICCLLIHLLLLQPLF